MPQQTKCRLSKSVIDAMEIPSAGQAVIIYRDTLLPGFGVRITANGVRTYIVEKRLKGRSKRISIGRHGVLTVDQGRKKAQQLLAEISVGEDPLAKRRAERLQGITLNEAAEAYLTARKSLKERSIADYRRHLEKSFGEWQGTSLSRITREMVSKRHTSLGAKSPAQADQAMRFLRAVFNYAQSAYTDPNGDPLIRDNPVKALTQTRAWHPQKRRQTCIHRDQMPAFYAALMGLSNPRKPDATALARDYITFILFTGCRRSEASKLLWSDVDLERCLFTLRDTKNGRDVTLPLPSPLATVLEARKKLERKVSSVFVFAKNNGRNVGVPNKHIDRLITASGVDFALHDLRRTFTTIADELDISENTIKRLLNHVTDGDVTAGYIIRDIERLRSASERIAVRIQQLAEPQAEEPLAAAA